MNFKSPQTPLSYAQLLEANNVMQNNGDETYWLCLTRTVQGSKLFPVSAYILFSYLNAFYRYPSLLRKIEERMTAEELGDRARNMGMKIQSLHMGWCLPAFYLLGQLAAVGHEIQDFKIKYECDWRAANDSRNSP